MAKSKLTLIVDGNWVLMSHLCKIHNQPLTDEEMQSELKMSIYKALYTVTRIYMGIDNIIFVADGGSWRADVTPPKFLSDKGIKYKGNRVKSPEYDWEKIFGTFADAMTELSENGITTCRADGIEGDDWIWYWSNKLNSEGTNCIIWSKDKDLTQLVRTNPDGCFTIWYNKDNGVVCENKGKDDVDWFFNATYTDNTQILENITRKSEVTMITPSDVIVDKVFRGDKSDNIMPIIKRKCNTDKEYRLSEKELDFTIDIFNEDETNKFIQEVIQRPKFLGKVTNPENIIREHLKYNLKIVALDKRSYPQKVLDTMSKYTTYNTCCDLSKIMNKYKAPKTNDLVDILETI